MTRTGRERMTRTAGGQEYQAKKIRKAEGRNTPKVNPEENHRKMEQTART